MTDTVKDVPLVPLVRVQVESQLLVKVDPEAQAMAEQILTLFPPGQRPSPEVLLNRAMIEGLLLLHLEIRRAHDVARLGDGRFD